MKNNSLIPFIEDEDPTSVRDMVNDEKEALLGKVKETKEYIKIGLKLNEEKISNLRLKDMKKHQKEATEKITIGGFEQWIRLGMIKEPIVSLVGWKILNFFKGKKIRFSEKAFSVVIGSSIVIIIGWMIFRYIYSNLPK